jgi:alkylation response protein AidB-like acyl-CoA dehydrogenase
MAPTATSPILPDAMLERFRERAPVYDRENRFFREDFDELRAAGYLTIAVPRELGGRGLTLAECMREQRRLASYAHATALAMNMHLYWVGVAADLWRAGERSL